MMMIKIFLLRYKRYFLGIALVFSSIAISIRSNKGKIIFVLQDYPFLIFSMILVSSILVAVYFQLTKIQFLSISNQIIEHYKVNNKEPDTLINELTDRQKAVYDLIIAGKTNKEIVSELFIEQSTLKTHINQIYKKLNIKNRRDLKLKT